MAHPHTIDPFKEVKEYMMEAEDYSASLTEKISVCITHWSVIIDLPKFNVILSFNRTLHDF